MDQILAEYRIYLRKRRFFLGTTVILLAAFIVIGISLGSSRIPLWDVLAALLGGSNKVYARIIWSIRAPRVLAAALAGCALAVSGAAMQSILRNPLGSPFTLGISQAAAFGAAFAIIALDAGSVQSSVTDAVILNNPYLVSGSAFLWSLSATGMVLLMARYRGATPQTMVLTGIVVGSLFNASITALEYFADELQLASVVFWTFGDLGRSSWRDFLILAWAAIPALLYFMRNSWRYNALDAGDETAKSLGINTDRLRIEGMVIASMATALVVSFFGIIAFVGLVVPHIVRRSIGSNQRFLIPVTALFGGFFLLAADTAARTIIAPVVLPVGILTSFLGGPLFLFLLIKGSRRN
ncbi:MAG: iron ABC transporter permease [Firmicutes bacterium]|nr:iron ABC transporter permease [Bacillota bacterium]